MPARDTERSRRFDLAIVGSSPFTRDLRAALVERCFPYVQVRLLGSPEGEVEITEFHGEPRIVGRAEPEALEGVDLAFFCEDPATDGAYRDWPQRGGYLAIDLSEEAGTLGDLPLAHAALTTPLAPRRGWLAAAHPLSYLLVSLLAPIESRVRLTGVRGVILRPASDFGEAGVDELYRQAVNLFNFSAIPSEVFSRQLAFNLIPGEALEKGRPLGALVASQVVMLLERPELPVNFFLAVAPVFHGHTVALHLVFEGRPTEAALRDLLRASGDLEVGAEPLTAVEVADERRPHVGLVRLDAEGRSGWMWAVADKVAAMAADGAVRLAERLLGVEPRPVARGPRGRARGGQA